MARPRDRYTGVAIILHWVMAVAFFLMLGSGLVMAYGDLPKGDLFRLYQWHKSLGVLLLLAFALRIGWRLVARPPALPGYFPPWEAIAARLGHWGLYFCMVALPLSGWAMVSASVYGLPTIVFGLFEWPHIPGLAGDAAAEAAAKTAHTALAILFGLLITVHLAAVAKHLVADRDNILARMWWSKGK